MPSTPLHTFRTPRRFDPAYSPLGRWMRRRTGDERRGEAYFYLALVGLGTGLLLAQYGAWALLHETVRAAPESALAFWIAQIALPLAAAAAAALGFRPGVEAHLHAGGLVLRQGRRTCRLAFDDVEAAEALDPRRYHRHYARYAATRAFVDRPERPLLLLRTAQGPVVLGLPEADLTVIREKVEVRRSTFEVEPGLAEGRP